MWMACTTEWLIKLRADWAFFAVVYLGWNHKGETEDEALLKILEK